MSPSPNKLPFSRLNKRAPIYANRPKKQSNTHPTLHPLHFTSFTQVHERSLPAGDRNNRALSAPLTIIDLKTR